MKLKILISVLCSFQFLLSGENYDIQPLEISSGQKKEPRTPLIAYPPVKANDFLVESNEFKVVFETAQEKKLWRDSVYKCQISKLNPDKKGGVISLKLKNPIPLKTEADSTDFWLMGPKNSRPQIIVNLQDTSSVIHSVSMVNLGSNWLAKPWWSMAHGVFPKGAEYKLHSIKFIFQELKENDDYFYFDALSFYKAEYKKQDFSIAEAILPFPNTPFGNAPSSTLPYDNSVEKNGDKYAFICKDKEGTVEFIYEPVTGTFSDIAILLDSSHRFTPLENGGLIINSPCKEQANILETTNQLEPEKMTTSKTNKNGQEKPSPKATIIETTFNEREKTLSAKWLLKTSSGEIKYEQKFAIRGRTLIIEVNSDHFPIYGVKAGKVSGIVSGKLLPVPFYEHRWEQPKILNFGKYFMSCIFDWYYSNASELSERSSIGPDKSIVITTGTKYHKLLNGQLNPIREKIYLTVSSRFADTLPNIPNPPSPYRKLLSKTVFSSRMGALGTPEDVENEIRLWKLLKAYGVKNIFVRYHMPMWRTPRESQNNYQNLEVNKTLTEEAVLRLVKELRNLGYLVGPYTDYMLIHPLHPEFSEYMIWKRPDLSKGSWIPGCYNTFVLRPWVGAQRVLSFDAKMAEKFPWNAVYSDQLTNCVPWATVDLEADTPDAGKFSSTIKAYGFILLKQREIYKGPVWGEGCAQYFWAGLTDSNYAQNRLTTLNNEPTLVDFILKKILPLQLDNGVDLSIIRDRLTRTKNAKDVYWMLCTQIAYGCAGKITLPELHLGKASQILEKQDKYLPELLKSYFMMQQLQKYYGAADVQNIEYADENGKLFSTEQAISTDIYRLSMVKSKYDSGLIVWTNRNPQMNWVIDFNSSKMTLPPSGFAAYCPGQLLAYSIIFDGHRTDYIQGNDYIYFDGSGKTTEFPTAKAAGAYVITKSDKTITVIPAPFQKEENIILKDVENVSFIVAFDSENKKVMDLPVCKTSEKHLEFKTKAGIFKYIIYLKRENEK